MPAPAPVGQGRSDSDALTARFARENGLDVKALRGDDDVARKKDPYRLEAGSALNSSEPLLRQISALRIDAPKRFGNSVIQLSNAIDLASDHSIGRIYAPGFWWINPPSAPQSGGITVLGNEAPDDETILSGRFYHRKSLQPLYPTRQKTIEEFRSSLMRVRSQIPLLDPCPPLPDDHLVVHIRSGDVFRNQGHPLYGQPPLAFYTLVLRKGAWRRVTLVSEDRQNPIIDRLLEASGTTLPPLEYRQASLEEDLKLLLRARSLVGSLGTFMPAVLALSSNVRRVICFGGIWYAATLRQRADVVVVKDVAGHYSRTVLASNWRNDPSQRALMIDYPESALRTGLLPCDRSPESPPLP